MLLTLKCEVYKVVGNLAAVVRGGMHGSGKLLRGTLVHAQLAQAHTLRELCVYDPPLFFIVRLLWSLCTYLRAVHLYVGQVAYAA